MAEDRDDKFLSREGEMEFLPIEEINRLRASTDVGEDEDEDELGLDDIDVEDLEEPDEDDE